MAGRGSTHAKSRNPFSVCVSRSLSRFIFRVRLPRNFGLNWAPSVSARILVTAFTLCALRSSEEIASPPPSSSSLLEEKGEAQRAGSSRTTHARLTRPLSFSLSWLLILCETSSVDGVCGFFTFLVWCLYFEEGITHFFKRRVSLVGCTSGC